jgi:hypothetical protein
MTELAIAMVALVSVAAIVVSLRQSGGCLRYPFLFGTLYLAWIAPQLAGLGADGATPPGGLFWLVVMVVLGLGASLIGWRLGMGQERRRLAPALPLAGAYADLASLFWPVAALTGFMVLLHVLIGLQPLADRQQSNWSGPLTIIAFFLGLSGLSLYLSLLLALRLRNGGALVLAGVNLLLIGTSAFVAVRRGVIVDFGIAAAGALWFGARRKVPVPLLAAAALGMIVVTYAIGPLRTAANEIAERTGSSIGLLSPEVWQRIDFTAEITSASREAVDLANAAHLIDYTNRWGEFTWGRQSWDAFIFQWVPAQIVGAELKSALMFRQGPANEQIDINYGYARTGGTTTTGFGFAYQEFGPFGCLYFLLIGLVMGRLWARADAGDAWAQGLYVSFAGGALLTVTHHAMWLIMQMPLFLLAVFLLKRAAGLGARRQRPVGGAYPH